MKVDVTVEVKIYGFWKFINNSYDYILVAKDLKIKRNNQVKIICFFWGWKLPVNVYRKVKKIEYNLIVKGYRSNTKLIIFED